MFNKVLIANRGEIAVRIIRACRELGIKSAVICPNIEKDSLPAALADEVVLSENRRVYLDIQEIIQAAKDIGAEAIHPGYGFLAENSDFAAKCAEAGLVFIGPSADAIKVMGEKTLARQTMQNAGVPVTPGSGVIEGIEEALKLAENIGYPVMIKASAGGGGRGIRIANDSVQLTALIPEAQKESKLAFNCADVYLEKYLDSPRHIEIQILADSYGTTVHLGERECSIQRRRQKLIEEAPSVAVTTELRAKMGEVAIRAAKSVNYCSAGTVEFLLDSKGEFYFMEMNTRIQVEHPVTELITGRDLIKEQIRIAAGERLSFSQSEISFKGWSIECRINAEDPERDFRPTPGNITEFIPPMGPWTRFDTCAFTGYSVSPFFDSMLGKLIVWGLDRKEAIARLNRALEELNVTGVKTSKSIFQSLLKDNRFQEGNIHINFLENWLDQIKNKGEMNNGRD